MQFRREIARLFRIMAVVAIVSTIGAAAAYLMAAAPRAAEEPRGPEVIPGPPRAIQSAPAAPRYVGAGSCAARACHGNPNLTPGQEWNSSYAVWVENDPHARAYNVLFTTESTNMAAALGIGDPWKADRCLSCHSMPVSGARAADTLGEVSTLRADGVSCEVCHGPAENYLVAHTIRAWLPKVKSDPHFGMTNTADIAVRAQLCANCHVGQPGPDGKPWRDVNHDLIAAGHPRLSFELSAFMATVPPHWSTSTEKPGKDPERFNEVRSWVDGQFFSAAAALKVLQARANAAAEKTNKAVVWPEFAEYDCYACHHDLNAPSWRQQTTAAVHHQPGRTEWGSWYYGGLETLAGTELLPAQSREKLQEDLKSLRGALEALLQTKTSSEHQFPGGRTDAAGQVAKETAAALAELDACRHAVDDSLASRTVGPNKLSSELVQSLRKRFEQHAPANWDGYAQYYLALVAINRDRALESAKPGATKIPPGPADGILNDIRNLLSFSRMSKQTGDQLPQLANSANAASLAATDASLRVLRPGVNSPQSFDPTQMRLHEMFQRAFQQLSTSSTPL
jgi:hypothetical protein